MNRTYLTLASLLTIASSLAYSETAHALGPVDIEIAARGGFATNPSSDDFSATPYGGGIGGRVGVSFSGLYLGLSGMYYFGASGQVQNSFTSITAPLHTAMEGFELGYTLPLPFVKLRPQIGLGNSTITIGPFSSQATSSGDGPSQSSSNLYVEPGLVLLIPLGTYFFVGADVNAIILPSAKGENGQTNGSSDGYVSLSVHGQVGIKL